MFWADLNLFTKKFTSWETFHLMIMQILSVDVSTFRNIWAEHLWYNNNFRHFNKKFLKVIKVRCVKLDGVVHWCNLLSFLSTSISLKRKWLFGCNQVYLIHGTMPSLHHNWFWLQKEGRVQWQQTVGRHEREKQGQRSGWVYFKKYRSSEAKSIEWLELRKTSDFS